MKRNIVTTTLIAVVWLLILVVGLPALAQTPEAPADFTYDPQAAGMLAQVVSTTVYNYDAQLSGEVAAVIGGEAYTFTTRNTNSGAPLQKATEFVYEHLQRQGLTASYHAWSNCGTSGRNVVGVLTGTLTPNEIVLITAHLDDVPSSGRAPGADDNASGSVGVMLAAEIMSQYHFERTVRFVFFTGEEQGLCGSEVYADDVQATGDNIVAVYNMDMIAYDSTGSPTLRLHTRTTSNPGYPGDLAIAGVFTNVVNTYGLSGALTPIIDPDGENRSDHSPFWDVGYPAILAIEDDDADFNDYYHTIDDNLSHINLTYFTNFVKASVGTAAHLAKPVTSIGPSLTPIQSMQTGAPGSLATHTLQLSNVDALPHTFDVLVGDHTWPIMAPISSGAMSAQSSRPLTITVAVPADALAQTSEVVSITVQAQDNTALRAVAILTTTAAPQYGVTLEPTFATQTGAIHQVIDYTLYLTNTGNLIDTFTLSASNHTWNAQIVPISLTLLHGSGAALKVFVTIPIMATLGASDTVQITAQGNGVSASSLLTTTITIHQIRLPLMQKD